MSGLREVSWGLLGVSPRAILGRHSKRHWYVERPEREAIASRLAGTGSERTLCGKLIPWSLLHASSEGDCQACLVVMRNRRPEGSREVLMALGVVAAVEQLVATNPDPPDGPALWRSETREGTLSEEDFIRQARSVMGMPERATGGLKGRAENEGPIMLDAARCGYCGGVIGDPAPQEMQRRIENRLCPCGRRRVTVLPAGGVLVHAQGCDGRDDCSCWEPWSDASSDPATG